MSTMPTIQTSERPPFVRFEVREHGLDAKASEEAGRPIPREVVFAIITPWGSKDELEKVAEEWLADIRRRALQGLYPLEWSERFNLQYKAWQEGNELPREGTPIRTWQMIAKQEPRRRLQALNIHTVEDLAAIPDSGLGGIGLDGRYLRDLARAWIAEGKAKGASAQALADANARIELLEEQLGRVTAQVAQLKALAEAAGATVPPVVAAPPPVAAAQEPGRRRRAAAVGAGG